MLWKVNRVAAWTTMLAGYAADFLWTFNPDLIQLPARINNNVYATILATVLFGFVMHILLPGEPGYLRQLKAAEEQ
jgi:hypothetical protein